MSNEDKPDRKTPRPLEYRDGRDDLPGPSFREFVHGMLISVIFIGFMIYEINLNYSLANRSAKQQPSLLFVASWIAIAIVFGFATYFLIRKNKSKMFWPGVACGMSIVCLLAGICAATQP